MHFCDLSNKEYSNTYISILISSMHLKNANSKREIFQDGSLIGRRVKLWSKFIAGNSDIDNAVSQLFT